mmetsp:Transcript_25872/g.49565  ORF Transcript_25872/g.49565 Transcript_25872/m.49565 type:complete len:220 (+) Transcript_25872:131-790(+)
MVQVDVDNVTAGLRLHGERLKQIRRMPLRSDIPELLAILESLSATDVTADGLRVSRIGIEVNDPVFRQHECPAVRSASASLVQRWKASVLAAKGRITSPKPTVVDDDVSTAASTQSPPTSVSSSTSPPIMPSSSTPPAKAIPPTWLPPGATMGDAEFLARCRLETVKAQLRERKQEISDMRRRQKRQARAAKAKRARLSLAVFTRMERKPTTKKQLKHS